MDKERPNTTSQSKIFKEEKHDGYQSNVPGRVHHPGNDHKRLRLISRHCSATGNGACGYRAGDHPRSLATEEPSTTPAAVSHGNEVGGYVDLVDGLRAAGATVEPAGEVEQAFFSVKGQIIQVNGADVQVFEYSDEAARQAESELISSDGTSIGTTMVTWVDQPNFWAKGRVIVLYLGKDPTLIDSLSGILGDPLTQHP